MNDDHLGHMVPSPAEPTLVVRLPVDGLDWSEHVPPVPHGHDVSVSFSRTVTKHRHAQSLAQLGYRIVGHARHAPAPPAEFVDMVIYGDTPGAHPSWWRAISALAERVYPLSLGPAARHCEDVVATHLADRR